MPMMNPNSAKLMQIITRKASIITGCRISRSTKKPAVSRITPPMSSDFVAAAPT